MTCLRSKDSDGHAGGRIRRACRRLVLAVLLIVVPGCLGFMKEEGPPVVVYSALDREFAEPILEEKARAAGLWLRPKFDIESTKTVGLANSIITEAGRPRCDLFWNNEILNTLRLKDKGLLQPFRPSQAEDLPPAYRDPEEMWYGFAARARILLVNTRLVNEADRPRSILDMHQPRWKGKIGIAKPLFGTTATHAACLFAALGDNQARDFFRGLRRNGVQVLSGNKQVATAVGAGELAFGLTDTDDAMGELDAGSPVAILYPDQGPGQVGTLFIPNTLAMIKGAPHAAEARKLADAILSKDVESRLARGPSAQIPLLSGAQAPARVQTPRTIQAMKVEFRDAAAAWDRTAAYLEAEFTE